MAKNIYEMLPKDILKKVDKETVREIVSENQKPIVKANKQFKFFSIIVLILTTPYFIFELYYSIFNYNQAAAAANSDPITSIIFLWFISVGGMIYGGRMYIYQKGFVQNWTHGYTMWLGKSNLENQEIVSSPARLYGGILFLLALLLYPPILLLLVAPLYWSVM